jgi:hypothetical protein
MRRVVRILVMSMAVSSVLALAASPGAAHDDRTHHPRDHDIRDRGHHDHDDHGGITISPTRDLIVPKAWAGEWQITTTYRRATGTVSAVDGITSVIRAGEPLGLSGLTRGGLAECIGVIGDHRLEAVCWRHVKDGGCHVTGLVHLTLERDGHTLEGSGATKLSTLGHCGELPDGRMRTTFELAGQRLSRDQGAAGQTLPPLLTRFIASVPFLTLAVTLPQIRPVIEDDCKNNAWRTFTHPSFKNQGQCIKFVHEQVRR